MAISKRGGRGARGGRGGRSSDRVATSTRSNSDQSLPMEPEDVASPIVEPQVVHASSASNGAASDNADSREGSQRRGITSGLGARRAMKSAKARLTVEFNFSLRTAICDNTEAFNNEISYLVRKNCSFRYKDWRLVPEEVRAPIRHKLLTLFDIDINNKEVKKVIDRQMNRAWKGQKYKFHSHFKDVGGEEDPINAKNKRHEDASQEDWDYLCDYWTTTKYLEKVEKNTDSRTKRKHEPKNGSKSTARHHVSRGADLDAPTGQIETWRIRNWDSKTGWHTSELEAKYKEMLEKREKYPPEKMTDKEILDDVLGRESVRLFGWGQSPSKSGKRHATEESVRLSYNQVLEELKELKEYKSRFEGLEGEVQMMRQFLIQNNLMPNSVLPRAPSDHCSDKNGSHSSDVNVGDASDDDYDV